MLTLPELPSPQDATSIIRLGVGGAVLAIVLCCVGLFGGLSAAQACTPEDQAPLVYLVAFCPLVTFAWVMFSSLGLLLKWRRLALWSGGLLIGVVGLWAAWWPLIHSWC